MPVSRQDTRVNHSQRNRTRAAITEAATALLREGSPPTVAEAAERAQVSRATAYRYFPTQESLLVEIAQVGPLMKPVDELVAGFPADHGAGQRLAAVIEAAMTAMLSDEVVIRTGLRVYMDTWLASHRDGKDVAVRTGRRMRYIDEALKPLGGRLGEPGRKRLRCALALTAGSEAITSLKDAAGLDDDEEIIATVKWAANALLQAAIHDFDGPR
jgi:AcrR family transcriptional regulator